MVSASEHFPLPGGLSRKSPDGNDTSPLGVDRGGSRASDRGDVLDELAEEHRHQRDTLMTLLELTGLDAPPRPALLNALTFIIDALPVHARYEDEQLLPMLKRRAHREDDLDRLLVELHDSHRRSAADRPAIVQELSAMLDRSDEARWPGALRERLNAFATRELRHLVFENAIMLPLARARLTDGDLENLRRVRQRRSAGVRRSAST